MQKLTGPDQGFLVSRLVLTLKPWERGWEMSLFMHIYICKNKLINFLFGFKQIRRRYMYSINACCRCIILAVLLYRLLTNF
jgi:hypothetical protein